MKISYGRGELFVSFHCKPRICIYMQSLSTSSQFSSVPQSCLTLCNPIFAISVVSSEYLQLLLFLPAILSPACASSGSAFYMMYSVYKLSKQDDNIHLPQFPTISDKYLLNSGNNTSQLTSLLHQLVISVLVTGHQVGFECFQAWKSEKISWGSYPKVVKVEYQINNFHYTFDQLYILCDADG